MATAVTANIREHSAAAQCRSTRALARYSVNFVNFGGGRR